ncbi:MAG: hypothetical protein JKY65_08340 [Planctomycetes bacterium]|nr:hypothetical protein [Planctomycetota bacterium]
MSDRGSRELSRRVASGDAQAEAELLARELRQGERDAERVALAAEVDRLGHLPELNTASSAQVIREVLREVLLPYALGGA